ncbi:unnamed protein product [Rhizoctonia solani]|uniref:Nephrocystin 3-like N-terminal domain-containing protein n=1 Tax=Rhizoctonia solani TaxID=456999 RepID=A0A8H3HDE8_9AGAM|nr:unnamed protein product [Rhizoctonia solani]
MPEHTTPDPQLGGGLGSSTVGVDSQGAPPPPVNHSSRTDRLKRWANSSRLRRILDQGVGSVGPLKAITDLVDCIVTPEEVLSGKKEYEALKEELDKTLGTLTQYGDDTASPAITATVESLCKDIGQELQGVKDALKQDRLGRLRESSNDLDEVLSCYNRIRGHLQRVSLNANVSMWKIVDTSATETRLASLQPAKSAHYNSAQAIELKRGPCTEGTRIDVLSQTFGWVGASNPGSVYWMSGMAGTGKTTIAYSLCEELSTSGRLAASFFCSRLLPECRDINRIIPSIAYQLARSSHPFRFTLTSVLENDPDVHTRLPHLQFDALIVQPLCKVRDTLPNNFVIVIDALDECENKDATSRILDVLLTKSENLPVKFIVSSRPEPEIRDEMTKQSDQDTSRMVLHELDRHAVQADIKTHLQTTLARVQPSEDEIAALVERAGILFIYAATVVRYISYSNFQGNSRARLTNVLSASGMTQKKHKEIDELYTTVLQEALENSELEDTDKDDMQQALRTVICAREPLTVDALSKLLGMDGVNQARAALRPLWSVLHISGTSEVVTTLHASFPDYMLDSLRSGQYYCDPQAHNQFLALRCFDCFRNVRPQFNICGLESSFVSDDAVPGLEERVKQAIAAEMFYAARYWAVHLQSSVSSPDLLRELENFLSERLLLWMEVMNLKKCGGAMPEMIRLVEKCDTAYPETLRALVHDSWRFTMAFASGAVSKSTPHIYASMLPFWPKSSPIARSYIKRSQRMIKADGTAIVRRQHALLTTWYFADPPFSPTFSPDGTQIALGLNNGVILLSTSTGQAVLPSLERDNGTVQSVQFSPDGARMVAGSLDGTVHVWSTQSGETVLGPLKGHTDWVTSIAFSPDGSRIVSGSRDRNVCIWDAYTGELLFDRLVGHDEWVQMTRYSPNGRYIISMGETSGVAVRDSGNGEVLKALRQDNMDGIFCSADISPDSTYIAFGTGNHSVYVWNIQTEQIVLGPLRAATHISRVTSISFSYNGIWIASGSGDSTVCMWDARTGDLLLGPLEGHATFVASVSFSPDDAYIISASGDRTLRLWDARGVQTSENLFTDHVSSVSTVGVSPDGTRVVSASENGPVCVWAVESGAIITRVERSTFQHEYTEVLQVAFSPDGTRILVNTNRGPLVFDAKSGTLCDLHVVHIPFTKLFTPLVVLTVVTFGILLVEPPAEHKLGQDFTATLWMLIKVFLVKTFELTAEGLGIDLLDLKPPPNPLRTLVIQVILLGAGAYAFRDTIFRMADIHLPHISWAGYSPDGTQIVSGSEDGLIQVCDARTNRVTLSISLSATHKYSHRLNFVSFSSDGNRIYSRAGHQKTQIYSADSGELLVDLNDPEWSDMIGFSPDGTRVVMNSDSELISLVDLASRERLYLEKTLPEELGSYLLWGNIIKFSTDGSCIASVLLDGSVGVWSAQTGVLLVEPIKVHVVHVRSLAFSPDGGQITTGSDDGTICMTDVQPTPTRISNSPESPTPFDWRLNGDGWIMDDQSQLLIWVPFELHASLMFPRARRLISRKGWLQLDFKHTFIGELWIKCYQPE